tara:strand:- start:5728 stop:6078 length:351 start_codon:yes stop_codon:yes gene_type:complete
MIISKNDKYILLLSYNPCDLFRYFATENLHGLNLTDCEEYQNTPYDSYIAGMSNIDPHTGEKYIFINLSRCTNDIKTMGLVMHETMHLAFKLFKNEEEIITFAENEAYRIIETEIK